MLITADSQLTASSTATADGAVGLYLPTLTVDDVIDALGLFLTPFVAGAAIVRAQVNRVPMPRTACVVLTELLQVDLETPVITQDPAGGRALVVTPTRIDVQIDFYGSAAGDQCKAVKGLYRTEYATSQFADGIKPLYCDDGRQTPLITGEQQWESRWTLTASLQYNARIAVPQQSAITLTPSAHAPADLIG